MSAALPTGTVTFLFTDIEGSTRLLQEIGDRYPDVLERHHRLLRAAIAAGDGVEVSTDGDAFFVAFAGATDAVRTAARAQRLLVTADWGHGIEVRVRMGIHTGDGRVRGDNYIGIDVHRAARIASAAHGGQVLVSAATCALVDPAEAGEGGFVDLGEHRLKDVDRPERLYQLSIDGVRNRFPPPRTLEYRRNNIPSLLTSFVSRERELGDIKTLLRSHRLVTLTGPGGTGKTRLALQVASDVLLAFPDGVFVVSLAPLSDPDLVAPAVASVVGARERGTIPLDEILADHLRGKRMLIVLDNFEHVLAAGPFVARTLAAAEELVVLATSRAPLRLAGEHEYPVPPMDLPDPSSHPPLEELARYESVALFTERARAVSPSFELSEDNAAAVTSICRRLDGLPLAIELAAARVRLLPPDALARRLDRALPLLTHGARDRPLRQQTLRETVAWSHALLDPPLQTLFRRLAVFVGGWSLEAVEAVCNPGAEIGLDTLDAVGALVDHSLVRSAENEGGAARFRMLQTIRDYALELLEADGDREVVRGRAADHFLAFAEATGPRVTHSLDAIAAVGAEHDNLRSILRWTLEARRPDIGLRIATSLWRFWMLASHLAEGRRWLSELLALAGDGGGSLRGRALLALGGVAYWQNDYDTTRRCFDEAVDVLRTTDDRAGLALALYNAAFPHVLVDDAAGARPYLEESRGLAEALGDPALLADTAWGLSIAALLEGDLEETARRAQEASDRYRSQGNWWGDIQARFVPSQVARLSGRLDEARTMLTGLLDELTTMQGLEHMSWVIQLVAALDVAQGHPARAVLLAGAAETMKEAHGGAAPPPLLRVQDPRLLVRDLLSPERIEELWQQGRALTPEEGLAHARRPPTSTGF